MSSAPGAPPSTCASTRETPPMPGLSSDASAVLPNTVWAQAVGSRDEKPTVAVQMNPKN